MGKSSTYIPYVWISQGLRRACVGPTQGSGRIPCAGFHPTARPWFADDFGAYMGNGAAMDTCMVAICSKPRGIQFASTGVERVCV